MAITMKELATKLNISSATVSRALSGKDEGVSEETKKAIFDAVATYGYHKRRTIGRSVAFVIDSQSFNLSSQFYAPIISGIEEELINHKYYFHFNSVEREKFDLSRINLNFTDLAGVIMVGVYHDDFVLKLRNVGIPMILVDYYIPTEDIPAVLIDNTDGILKACKYLASAGHRRIAYLSGDSVETSTQERLYGYRRAREIFDLDQDERLIVPDCRSQMDEGFRAMNQILDLAPLPTAVVAYNDVVAVGAMDALKHRGLSIPSDMSVVGFDDIRLASQVNPALTTVRVPKETIGFIAVKRLLQIIRGKEDPVRKTLIPTNLVIRASSAEAS